MASKGALQQDASGILFPWAAEVSLELVVALWYDLRIDQVGGAFEGAALERQPGGLVSVCLALCGVRVLLANQSGLLSYDLAVLEDGLRVPEDEIHGTPDNAIAVELSLRVCVECVLPSVDCALIEGDLITAPTHRHRLVAVGASCVEDADAFTAKPIAANNCLTTK